MAAEIRELQRGAPDDAALVAMLERTANGAREVLVAISDVKLLRPVVRLHAVCALSTRPVLSRCFISHFSLY